MPLALFDLLDYLCLVKMKRIYVDGRIAVLLCVRIYLFL